MAGMREVYQHSRDTVDEYSGWGHPGPAGDGRRPIVVPQFEPDSGMLFTTGSTSSRIQLDDRKPKIDSVDGSGLADHYAGLGIGVAGLVAESLIAHPLVVLRRTCQVSSSTVRYHHTPLTLMPVVLRLYRCQGVPSLWKGFGSSLIIRGLVLTAEDCVSKFTPWPKEFENCSSIKTFGQHLMLKALSLAIVTPFYSISLIESVQSEIASERPGLFDIFRDGFARVVSGGGPRALPMWYLIPATVSHGILHYIVSSAVKFLVTKLLRCVHRQKQELCGAVSKRDEDLPGLLQFRDRVSGVIGHLVGDILLYPMQTVLHRLHLQGSRTIIDNLDTGFEVLPVTTGYQGVYDCINEVNATEGISGFYRGFGALIVQYILQFAIIRLSSISIREIMKILKEDSVEPSLPILSSNVATSTKTSPGSFQEVRQMTPQPGLRTASPLRINPDIAPGNFSSRFESDPFSPRQPAYAASPEAVWTSARRKITPLEEEF